MTCTISNVASPSRALRFTPSQTAATSMPRPANCISAQRALWATMSRDTCQRCRETRHSHGTHGVCAGEKPQGPVQFSVKGTKALIGGKPRGDGLFYEPTVLVDVNHDMDYMRDETFGPTLPVMAVRDAAEAIEKANDSRVRAVGQRLDARQGEGDGAG